MKKVFLTILPFFLIFCLVLGLIYGLYLKPFLNAYGPVSFNESEVIQNLSLPPGFEIEIYARVENARSLEYDYKNNILYVGNRAKDKVYALLDSNRDYSVDKIYIIAESLNMPNGVALKGEDLYVAEIDKIHKFENIADNLENPQSEVIYEDLPEDRNHAWKYISFGPEGLLYVPIGAPCNICDPELPYSALHKIDVETGERSLVAQGIRNTVGFTWHPKTEVLWFSDNGRDRMGNDIPPDELNKVSYDGEHFGYPYCHGSDIQDPEFGELQSCEESTAPQEELGPHVAALGIEFYTANQFPEDYQGDLFIAEHGSWNRDDPIGYRITKVDIVDGEAQNYEVFIDGWLIGEKGWGRPVDLEILPDGSMLISDDKAGLIYRVVYTG
jgi:glucose/arabinose dehydrogenase